MELIDKEALVQDLLDKSFYPAIVRRAIEQQPVIDAVEVVHAEWVVDTEFATKTKYKCSACGRTIMANNQNPNIKFPYCHCGAKMDGSRESEET